jgi:hypothetical protein
MSDYYPQRARTRKHAIPVKSAVPAMHPEPKAGTLESIADEIATWIEETSTAVAAAMMDGTHAPFSARASQQELAAFYGETLFGPDGMPVQDAWVSMYQRTGAEGLREAVEGGAEHRRSVGMPVIMPPPTAWAARPPESEE